VPNFWDLDTLKSLVYFKETIFFSIVDRSRLSESQSQICVSKQKAREEKLSTRSQLHMISGRFSRKRLSFVFRAKSSGDMLPEDQNECSDLYRLAEALRARCYSEYRSEATRHTQFMAQERYWCRYGQLSR